MPYKNKIDAANYARYYQKVNRDRVNTYMRKYREKNKDKINERTRKSYIKNPEIYRNYQKKYRNKNKEICNEKHRQYMQTENGKKARRKWKAKRRNLSWIKMFPNPFDNSVLVDYHHITDVYVVAVPRELHKLYYGKNHREKMMEIVKQIYM